MKEKNCSLYALINKLKTFWTEYGCVILPAWDMEVGAGTMSPYTFFYVLNNDPYNACYVQPSRRPSDGRYGDNPNRVYKHHQLQVVLQPVPEDIQELYVKSLAIATATSSVSEKIVLSSLVIFLPPIF